MIDKEKMREFVTNLLAGGKDKPNTLDYLLLYIALLIIKIGRNLIPKKFPKTREFMFTKLDFNEEKK